MGRLKVLDFEDGRNGYVIAVVTALLIVSVLLGYYYVSNPQEQNGYVSISVLDAEKNADNYPEYLISGENSTFSVYFKVDNHLNSEINSKVYVLITSKSISNLPISEVTPTATYVDALLVGDSKENIVTISLNEAGSYSVIFELWIKTPEAEAYEFSQNYCVLNVQVA